MGIFSNTIQILLGKLVIYFELARSLLHYRQSFLNTFQNNAEHISTVCHFIKN